MSLFVGLMMVIAYLVNVDLSQALLHHC